MRSISLVALVCLVTSARITAKTKAKGAWKQHFTSYMATLTATPNPEGIRTLGIPRLLESRKTESKGLVVMQHGFTASPNFYYKVFDPLLRDGWDVISPLFPGHGRRPTVQPNGSSYIVTDWIEEIPIRGVEYEAFGDEMITISQKYKDENPGGQLVLVGTSHGGAMVAYMAMRSPPGLFDRVLFMNPFFAPPTGLGADFGLSFLRDIIPQLLPFISLFKDRFSWGAECEELSWPTGNDGGTGAFCQFSAENMRGVLEFANNVEGEMRYRAAKNGVFTGGFADRAWGVAQSLTQWAWTLATGSSISSSNLKVQILTTENDGAISNFRVHFAAEALSVAVEPGNFGFCAFPEEMLHTYINPIDKPPNTDMWWMDRKRVRGGKNVIDLIVDFVSRGTLVPTRGLTALDSSLQGDSSCDMVRSTR